MQKHFSYDELTPLEQCITIVMSGRVWGRDQLPTYEDEDRQPKKQKRPRH